MILCCQKQKAYTQVDMIQFVLYALFVVFVGKLVSVPVILLVGALKPGFLLSTSYRVLPNMSDMPLKLLKVRKI